MAPYSLVPATAALLACAGLLAAGAGTAAAQEPPENDSPPGLERLWSEYPLNPQTPSETPQSTQPNEAPVERPQSERPPPARPETAPLRLPREDPLSVLLVSLAGLTALVVVIIIVLAGGPVRLPGVRAQPAVRLRVQGGTPMTDVFRRIRRRDAADREESDMPAPREDQPVPQRPRAPVRALQPNSLERSTSVQESHDPADRVDLDAARLGGERELATAAQVGEHVTAVIASAQQAAEQMRREAAADAERIRAEAREESKSRIAEATREAEKMRGDAGMYSREARQDADAYAGEKRSEAEAYASRVRVEADENAREMRDAAKQEAKRIEKEARRRREVLTGEAERFEERLHSLHTVFQGITSQLEALLSKEPETEGGEGRGQESLTEALNPSASEHVPT